MHQHRRFKIKESPFREDFPCHSTWKRGFPILAYGCRLKLETFLTIIVATSVLHNAALNMGDIEASPIPAEIHEHILEQLIRDGQIPGINNDDVREVAGSVPRRILINDYFQRRVYNLDVYNLLFLDCSNFYINKITCLAVGFCTFFIEK
jgi:hypothetical protein